MPDSSTSLTLWALGGLLSFVGVGGLLGWAQFVRNWRRPALELLNLEASTAVHHATQAKLLAEARKLEADSAHLALEGAFLLVAQLRTDVERLRGERDNYRGLFERSDGRVSKLTHEVEELKARLRAAGGEGR
jgi:hypothetical protein